MYQFSFAIRWCNLKRSQVLAVIFCNYIPLQTSTSSPGSYSASVAFVTLCFNARVIHILFSCIFISCLDSTDSSLLSSVVGLLPESEGIFGRENSPNNNDDGPSPYEPEVSFIDLKISVSYN